MHYHTVLDLSNLYRRMGRGRGRIGVRGRREGIGRRMGRRRGRGRRRG